MAEEEIRYISSDVMTKYGLWAWEWDPEFRPDRLLFSTELPSRTLDDWTEPAPPTTPSLVSEVQAAARKFAATCDTPFGLVTALTSALGYDERVSRAEATAVGPRINGLDTRGVVCYNASGQRQVMLWSTQLRSGLAPVVIQQVHSVTKAVVAEWRREWKVAIRTGEPVALFDALCALMPQVWPGTDTDPACATAGGLEALARATAHPPPVRKRTKMH